MTEAGWWRIGGLITGLGAAWYTAQLDPLGRGAALAAPVFALCVLLGALAGERRRPRPELGVARSASLQTRRAADYLPRAASLLALGMSGLLVTVLAATTAAAVPDDLGRTGRAFQRVCGEYTTIGSPWPGWFYAGPILAIAVAGAGLAALVIRTVVLRPRPGDDPGLLIRDEDDRRRIGTVTVASYGILVCVPLAGSAFFAAGRLRSTTCDTDNWPNDVITAAAFGIAVAAAITATYFIALLLVPAPPGSAARSQGAQR